METITFKQHLAAQAFIEACREAIHPLQINTVPIEHIDEILFRYGRKLDYALSPWDNDIRTAESFGLTIEHEGMPVATVCARALQARDFVADWHTNYRLFGNALARLEFPPFEYVEKPPVLSGTIGYGGGSWVHPDWQGMKLWAVTSRLGKTLALIHLNADYYVALMKHRRTQAARETLGWPNTVWLTRGHHAGREGWESDIDMHWMDRGDIVRMFDDLDPVRAVGRAVRSLPNA